jgi:hypothetical protein
LELWMFYSWRAFETSSVKGLLWLCVCNVEPRGEHYWRMMCLLWRHRRGSPPSYLPLGARVKTQFFSEWAATTPSAWCPSWRHRFGCRGAAMCWYNFGWWQWPDSLVVPSSVFRRGCLLLSCCFFVAPDHLRQIGRAPRSRGGVVLVVILVVLDDLAWSCSLVSMSLFSVWALGWATPADGAAPFDLGRGSRGSLRFGDRSRHSACWSMCGLIFSTMSSLQVAASVALFLCDSTWWMRTSVFKLCVLCTFWLLVCVVVL